MSGDEWRWLTLKTRGKSVASRRRWNAQVAVVLLYICILLPCRDARPPGGRRRVPQAPNKRYAADALMRFPGLTIGYDVPFVNSYKAYSCTFRDGPDRRRPRRESAFAALPPSPRLCRTSRRDKSGKARMGPGTPTATNAKAEPRLGYEGNQPRRHEGTEGKKGSLNREIRERRELLDRINSMDRMENPTNAPGEGTRTTGITGRTGAGEFLTTDDTDQHGWVGQRATESRENPFFRAEAQRAQRGGGNREPREIRECFDHGFHGWTRMGPSLGLAMREINHGGTEARREKMGF